MSVRTGPAGGDRWPAGPGRAGPARGASAASACPDFARSRRGGCAAGGGRAPWAYGGIGLIASPGRGRGHRWDSRKPRLSPGVTFEACISGATSGTKVPRGTSYASTPAKREPRRQGGVAALGPQGAGSRTASEDDANALSGTFVEPILRGPWAVHRRSRAASPPPDYVTSTRRRRIPPRWHRASRGPRGPRLRRRKVVPPSKRNDLRRNLRGHPRRPTGDGSRARTSASRSASNASPPKRGRLARGGSSASSGPPLAKRRQVPREFRRASPGTPPDPERGRLPCRSAHRTAPAARIRRLGTLGREAAVFFPGRTSWRPRGVAIATQRKETFHVE